VISVDRAVGTSLSPDAVTFKIDRFVPRAAPGRLEPPLVRDKNGLSRLRTVTAQESRSYGHGQRRRSEVFDVACGDAAGGLVQAVPPPSPCKQNGVRQLAHPVKLRAGVPLQDGVARGELPQLPVRARQAIDLITGLPSATDLAGALAAQG
jgi:hypothetical protein